MKGFFLASFLILAGVVVVIQAEIQKKDGEESDEFIPQGKIKYCIRSGSKCDTKWKCCRGNCVNGKCVKKGVKPTSNGVASPITYECNGDGKTFQFWDSQTSKCVVVGGNKDTGRSELQSTTCGTTTQTYHFWKAVVLESNIFKLQNVELTIACIFASGGTDADHVGITNCNNTAKYLQWTDLNRRDQDDRFQLENVYFTGKCLAYSSSKFYLTTCGQNQNSHWFRRAGCYGK